jgi:hypothetical protein
VQPLRPKTLHVIFVAGQDLTLIVSVKTRRRCKALGFDGMHFKWDRDRQKWYGPISLENLEALDSWPEAELSPEARLAVDEFRGARGNGGSTAGEGFRGSSILPAVSGGDGRATNFYIIGGIRGTRMPRRRVSWHSTVPW